MGKKTKVGKTRKDKFYQLAKETGFRSRAAFKLIQLNRKFGFLQQSQVCLDLCAAPGGWMQVAKQNMPVSSIVIGVDLFPIRPIAGCIGLVEDITTEKCRQSLTKELQSWKADVVLHDGAPNVGRNWLYDAYQQICLTLNALKLTTQFLRGGGWFVTKVFRSKDYNALLWVLKQLFKKVHATKPSASRKESAEIFVICQEYLAPDIIDHRLLDCKYVFEELDLESKKKNSLLHPERQKRIKAEGYSEQEISLRTNLAATEFMTAENGLAALQGVGSIRIDDERIANHIKTTPEILECCKDLKVLGRKDIKGIVLWWKAVKDSFFKTETTVVIEKPDAEETIPKTLTQAEIEDIEDVELQQQISTLTVEEQKELKRKRKKTLKAKAKLHEKMNLNMIIKGDDGPVEETVHEIFDLKVINSVVDLDRILDVNPDFDIEVEGKEPPKLPKYKKYHKDDNQMDDDGHYENEKETELSNDEDSDEMMSDERGLGLSDDGEDIFKGGKGKKKYKEHPLIKSSDFRDKDTKRQQRVQLWYEKNNLQNIQSDDDEENYDLSNMAKEYNLKGVSVLNKSTLSMDTYGQVPLGKKAKRRARHETMTMDSSSECSDSEEFSKDTVSEDMSKEPKSKKVRLTENELALGAFLIRGKKTQRELIDAAWNRYAFNDENLPAWFTQDEKEHMTTPQPVPQELTEEYKRKVQELNVRPIKKVMEAKARKKRRSTKRLAKAKKMAEKIMDNADASTHEKAKQLRKVYKKAQEKKKEITYVVAKKHTASRRASRPAGVKGRYRVVDPREKKDKRSSVAKKQRQKSGKIGKGKQ
ncbi:pre-rRNA 2'-O-ribose RNA methyltransferase FTSJ3 [Drosophila obscura]|uniref:pre-rRNA 2'-O-ribose RNA methyltransferase FTSJ3 n=1 Tax=Drosophila obscura TaxID=7282 RepID=UPI001BB1AB6C|nr:pre-rRNA 2'-O-ribose RNA methyltransferase FTSJ3 [Drosophila obscura]